MTRLQQLAVACITAIAALWLMPVFPAARGTETRATQPSTQPAVPDEKEAKKITLAEFEKMRAEKDTVVLDVRTPREFAAGHVPGAVNIDWHSRSFNDQVSKLDKSKRYLVHCLSGFRSEAATKRMSTMDFTQLYDYSHGWSEYAKSGQPVEK